MTSDAVKRLADKYTMTTADKVPVPPPKPRTVDQPAAAPTPRQRQRWDDARKDAFARWGITALYVAGPKAPVPRGIGDNRLGWPLRFGTTKVWEDNVTDVMDGASPYHWQGVWFRVWTPTRPHARQLLTLLVDALSPSEGFDSQPGSLEDEIRRFIRAEPARHAWHDVGEDFDFPTPDRKVEAQLGLTPLPRTAMVSEVRERRFVVVRHKFKAAIIDLAGRHAIETWDDDAVENEVHRRARERLTRMAQADRNKI